MIPSLRGAHLGDPVRAAFLALVFLGSLPASGRALQADAGLDHPGSPGGNALRQCALTFEPAAVPLGGDSVIVVATVSEPVGLVLQVAFAEESGIDVESHSPVLMAEGRFRLVLDLDGASGGDWAATMTGSDGSCTGVLAVGDTPSDRRRDRREAKADRPGGAVAPRGRPHRQRGPESARRL